MSLINLTSSSPCPSSDKDKDIEMQILTLEKEAMKVWNQGNPDSFLALSSDNVTYMDPFLEKKLVGKSMLKEYYEQMRGTFTINKCEFVNPTVQVNNDTAVLTYNLYSSIGEEDFKWHCTEVYAIENGKWKIIHTHWSLLKE